ncbi:MAG: histidinol phosphatase [Actinobacteria bacterium]|nr:histidinol phosphatase [Actinomycetota bacterium]
MPRFRARDLHVETKPDLTPVSEADRAVEAALREQLATDRPDDGVLGEEMGETGAGSPRRWIVDPIDGTMSYVRGVPAWATLIALESEGVMSVGVVSAPAFGRRWWAAKGSGAFADGERIQVSEVHALEDAHVCAPNERYFESGHRRRLAGLAEGWRSITRRAWRPVGFADFWGHMLVAEGAVDVMVEPTLSLWDVAALRPIVEEAGGRVSDLSGDGWAHDGPCVTTNGVLHDEVLDMLNGSLK